MFEEYIPAVARGIVLGVVRGLRGFSKHKKEDSKETFDLGLYVKSVAVCTVIGVVAEFLLPFLPIGDNMILDVIAQYIVPWVGTDVLEDIFSR